MTYAKRVDENQKAIVSALRDIPGVKVAPGHDDILVGYNGATYWFEIKKPEVVRKDGALKAGALKPSQIELLRSWTGHYRVVWELEQVLEDIGITHKEIA